jgi:NO-binding membrane sensor protein with MHYT domain
MNAPVVGAILDYQYDWAPVALSFVISVLGSYVALSLASARDNKQDRIVGPAVALGGCGIWGMHLIGMTAYKTPLYVSFSMVSTVLSLVIAILITALGFRLALKGPGKLVNLVIGGSVIGGGVVAMHYLGMLGMDVRATTEWNWATVAFSVVIAVVAATVALWLAFNVKTTSQRLMAAATFICAAQSTPSAFRVDGPYLGFLIFGFSLIALAFSIMYDKIGLAHA